jgi:hypothetical protein
MLATDLSERASTLYKGVVSDTRDAEWWNELYSLDHELVNSAVPALGEDKAAEMIESFRKVFDSYTEVIAAHISEGYFTTALSWFDLLTDFMRHTDEKMQKIGQALPDEYHERLIAFLLQGGMPSDPNELGESEFEAATEVIEDDLELDEDLVSGTTPEEADGLVETVEDMTSGMMLEEEQDV